MDLEDEGWVSVPCDGLLEVHDDGGEKIFSRKYVKSPAKFYEPNHFNTIHTSQDYVEDEQLLEKQFDREEDIKEMIKLPILTTDPKETSFEPESNQDPIFQVFFKKENQSVEMTTGSPRLSSQEFDMSPTETGPFQYEKKNNDHAINCSSPKMIKKEVVACKESNQRLNLLKWGLNGIGVFCSIGMAAATICIIICENGRRHKQQQNQKLKFQIYPDNKRINQVVQKANEAMSAVRGVPLVNAQITNGGYYENH